ncbi:MAG: hypothetical protein H7Y30_18110, partial [Pyrinomonadaceae bacterium]|nr:hypothetical protein [Pyrinomonadaceae bacterium]
MSARRHVRKQLGAASSGFKQVTTRVRGWLRRFMPRLAIAAAALIILRLLFGRTWLFGDNFFGNLLGFITFTAVFFTCFYYGIKFLRWLKRRVLWRVRRRLTITYLFVGLTPIVLLLMLGMLSAFGGSNQAMSRIISSQLNATERQALSNVRSLADAFARLPANMDESATQSWIEERATNLSTSPSGCPYMRV